VKLMTVVRRGPGTPREVVHERCKHVPAFDGIVGWVANVADVSQDPVGGGEPTAEAVIEIRLAEGAAADPGVLFTMLDGLDVRCEVYEVEERLMWDRHGEWPLGARAVGFNRVALVPRLPSVSHDEFATHWTDRHGPIAERHHPGIARYVQNIVLRTLTAGAPDWDGIAELHFVRTTDFTERMYDSPEGRDIVREDVLRFIDPSRGERFLLGRWTIVQDPLTRGTIPRDADHAR
jgi:uncharacterized protein (TIGR02118 family)